MTTITITDSAANKVRKLREEEGDKNLMLRVYVTGGAVRGFHMDLISLRKKAKTMPALKTTM